MTHSHHIGRPLVAEQEMYGDAISEMLTVQYRMNADVMRWSSDELYGGRLTAAPLVAEHTLGDIQVRGLGSATWQQSAVKLNSCASSLCKFDSSANAKKSGIACVHDRRLQAVSLCFCSLTPPGAIVRRRLKRKGRASATTEKPQSC